MTRSPRPFTKLECSACGAEADAACNCGAPYVPASARAAAAIAKNPGKSDRAIATELGVNQSTVSRARKSTDANASVGKRTGKDGKTRKMPRAKDRSKKELPKTDAVRKALRETVEAGKPIDRQDWAKQLDVSEGTVQRAEMQERAYLEGFKAGLEEDDPLASTPTKTKKDEHPLPQPVAKGPHKWLTPQEVDPEFTGTPMEFTAKYGHVQIMTAQEYATMRFSDWASYINSLAKLAKKMPELRDVDHNWLRAPKPNEVAKLTEALEYLRPKIAKAEALLTTAVTALRSRA